MKRREEAGESPSELSFPNESRLVIMLVGLFIGAGTSLSLVLGYQYASEVLGPGLGLLIIASAVLSGMLVSLFLARRWFLMMLERRVQRTLSGMLEPLNDSVARLQDGRWVEAARSGQLFVRSFVVWNAQRSFRAWVVGVVVALLAAVAGVFGSYLVHVQNGLVEQQNEFFQEQIRSTEREAQIARRAELIATIYDEIPCFDDESERCPRSSARARADAVVALRQIQCLRARREVKEENKKRGEQGKTALAAPPGCGVDLTDADLGMTNLEGVDLHATTLVRVTFEGANLTRSNLKGADLRGAIFSSATITGARLANANLVDAVFDDVEDLSGADLSGARLSRVRFEGISLPGAKLEGADLYGADFREADLSGADLSRASLQRATLYDTNLAGAKLNDADLTGANLQLADLSGANLSGASLNGANLSEARYSNSTRWPRGFRPPSDATNVGD